jgi:hypothetical protein
VRVTIGQQRPVETAFAQDEGSKAAHVGMTLRPRSAPSSVSPRQPRASMSRRLPQAVAPMKAGCVAAT